MFDYMVGLEANQLKAVFEKYDMTDEDRVCIKELILGKPLTRRTEGAEVMGGFEIYCSILDFKTFLSPQI